jgi:hypothetical protein
MIDQMNLLDWQPAPARNSDPETSHLAADRAGMKASHSRMMVLRHLIASGPMTDFELADATGVIQSSIGKRRGEVRDWHMVEACTAPDGSRLTRKSPSGSPAIVWQVTDAGRAFFNKNFKGHT